MPQPTLAKVFDSIDRNQKILTQLEPDAESHTKGLKIGSTIVLILKSNPDFIPL